MSRLEIGDVLENRYRVDRPIARGGMSTVYRCVDLRLGRAVAAKVMHAEFVDDPVFTRRFEREAKAMAQLAHPNLVGVYDFSADGKPMFLIMELITGGTLRELLAERGPLPPYAAAGVMRSVLAGLTAVHNKGLIHRDIKPDNVLINADHRVMLGDFGLVRSTSAQQATSDKIVGTVSYLAPEQVDGSPITPATDVYSAGVVLFELLTGTVPFQGETTLAHALARLQEDAAAPSERIAGIPPLFDALVASATARQPQARFADAGEFLAALDDVTHELDLRTYTVPVPQDSAAARTAAQPTDMSGTAVFAATGVVDIPDATSAAVGPREPATEAKTRTLSEHADPEADTAQSRRSPQNYETRLEEAPAAPRPTPASAAPVASADSMSPATPAACLARTAEKEPTERLLTNRSWVPLTLFLVAAAVLTGSVALAAWWFGSGNYADIPIVWRNY